MVTDSRIETRAHKIGQYVGQVWRNWIGEEQRLVAWLIKRNFPAGIARVLPWCFRLIVLGLLLYYVGFWLAVLLAIVIVAKVSGASRGGSGTEEDGSWSSKDEWRQGESGYGLYSSSGQRVDPHDPDDED